MVATVALALLVTGCTTGTDPMSVTSPSLQATYTPNATGCLAAPPDILPSPESVPPSTGPVPTEIRDDPGAHWIATHLSVTDLPEVSSDSHVYIGFTTDAAQNLAALRAVLPDPQRVRAYCTTHTSDEIYLAMEQLSGPFLGHGIVIWQQSRSAFSDRYDLGIDPYTPATVAWIRHQYADVIGRLYKGDPSMCTAC